MATTLSAGPATEPITTAEAKLHLRVDHSIDDALIDSMTAAAREWAEAATGRKCVTQTWLLKLDAFPSEIRPPFPPLSSVTSIGYIDTAGVTQTLSASSYSVDTDSEPGRIVPAYGESWPSTRGMSNAVTVTYVCGYGAASAVPDSIKAAIKLLLGNIYEHREDVVPVQMSNLPDGARHLLSPYRVFGADF